jgi:hypothetical protein
MANVYYSGQGSLLVATRNATTGLAEGFVPVGNVPKLTIDIEIDKFEHKESESGDRLVDLTIVKEKKGKFSFTMDNLSIDNLALGLYGTSATVNAGTVTDESIKGWVGKTTPVKFPGISGVVLTNAAGTTTYTLGTHYTVDSANGTITIPATGSTITDGQSLLIDYTYAAHKKMDAFTSSAAPERWFRFQGLNTANGTKVIVDMFRARIDPLTGYDLINDEIAAVEIKGDLLSDDTKLTGSKFFVQINA